MIATVRAPELITAPAPRSVGRLLRNREAAFWSLQLLGWSAYFIAQFVSALFYPEKFPHENVAGYVYVLLDAAVSGFVLSSLLRYAYRRVRDSPPRSWSRPCWSSSILPH